MGRPGRAWLMVAALAIGCTTVMYPGPRRAKHEVAVLVSSETSIDELDGQRFVHVHRQDGARYEVLPGRHQLGISLFIVTITPGSDADIERSHDEVEVCLDTVAGHTYVISHEGRGHEGRGEQWRPVIYDEATGANVPFLPCPVPP